MSTNFFKKVVLLLCLLLSISMALTGCTVNSSSGSSSTPSDTSSSEEPSTDPNVINLKVGIVANTSENDMMKAVKAAYEKKNKNVKINIVQIAGVYAQQVVNLASSGQLPDVFANLDTLVGYLAKSHVSLQLDSYLDKYNIKPSDFYSSMYELGVVNGELHMLPREYSHVVVYYNKKMLQNAGVDTSIVQNGWTWAQFISVAEKLVTKRGSIITQYGADLQLNWPTTVMSYIYGMGGEMFSTDKKSCTIDSANTQAAYTQLKNYVDNGLITNVYKAGMPTFLNSKVGMYCSVRPQANLVHKTLGADWDVVSFPQMQNAVSVGSGTTGYSVSKDSEHVDEALDFLMYMMSDEGMNVMSETGLIVPSKQSLNTLDAAWRKYPSANINQDAFIYMPENDMRPLSSFLLDPSKASKVTDAMNLATESLLASATNFESYRRSITTAMN